MLGTLVGGTQYMSPKSGTIGWCLDVLELDEGRLERIPLTFLAHGFATRPGAEHVAALFEKKGPGGCLVDLARRQVLRAIEPLDGNHFYGHGAYSGDGRYLYAVESVLMTGEGKIVVRDADSLEVCGEIPTYGDRPHDCVLIEEGRVLAVTNGGGPLGGTSVPSVTFVDVASGALLERLVLTNTRINAGHLAVLGRGDFAVVSAPRDGLSEDTSPGGVSLRSGCARLVTMKSPGAVVRRMLGETLSACIHEPTGVVAATSPKGNLVTFWHMTEQRLVKTWDVQSPRGVTLSLDGRFFVFGCGREATIVLVDTSTLEPVPREYGPQRMSGSHVYLWREAARFAAAQPQ